MSIDNLTPALDAACKAAGFDRWWTVDSYPDEIFLERRHPSLAGHIQVTTLRRLLAPAGVA